MNQPCTVRCPNCGMEWTLEARSTDQGVATVSAAACPVCHLLLSVPELSGMRLMSISDLETELDVLMSSARASGLAAETIVDALRDELEFAAEMGHLGHHFVVQLIDLGPREGAILQRPVRDRRAILQSRSINE